MLRAHEQRAGSAVAHRARHDAAAPAVEIAFVAARRCSRAARAPAGAARGTARGDWSSARRELAHARVDRAARRARSSAASSASELAARRARGRARTGRRSPVSSRAGAAPPRPSSCARAAPRGARARPGSSRYRRMISSRRLDAPQVRRGVVAEAGEDAATPPRGAAGVESKKSSRVGDVAPRRRRRARSAGCRCPCGSWRPRGRRGRACSLGERQVARGRGERLGAGRSARRRAGAARAARGARPAARRARDAAASGARCARDVDAHPEQVAGRSRRGSASGPTAPVEVVRRLRVRPPRALEQDDRLERVGVEVARPRRRASTSGAAAAPRAALAHDAAGALGVEDVREARGRARARTRPRAPGS